MTPHEEVELFALHTYEPGDLVEIRYVHRLKEKDGGPSPFSDWYTPADLPSAVGRMGGYNRVGWNIHPGVNPRRLRNVRGNANVEMARNVVADFDGTEVEEAALIVESAGLPAPTLVIASGRGAHLYWRLSEPITHLDAWQELQKDLIAAVGSDKCIHNAERVMRMPGFLNAKYAPSPACRIVSCDLEGRYGMAELNIPPRPKSLPAPTAFPSTSHSEPMGRLMTDREIALRCLPHIRHLAYEYADWVAVGMILHRIDPGPATLAEWDAWSRSSDKYQSGECEAKWRSFGPCAKPRTVGSLVAWARRAGFDPFPAKDDDFVGAAPQHARRRRRHRRTERKVHFEITLRVGGAA